MQRRTIIYICMFASGFCEFFCTGEVEFITEKPQLWMLVVTMFLNGGTLACLYVMTFPEMVEAAEDQLYLKKQPFEVEELNASMSSAFVLTTQVSQGVAPFLANLFAGLYSFNISYKIQGTTVILYTMIYFACVGFTPYEVSI